MERYKDRIIAYSLGNFATYYGISVAGIKGIAPILTVTLDGNGGFVEGDIVSTIQLRPAGPSIDPQDRALKLMRGLSEAQGSAVLFITHDLSLMRNVASRVAIMYLGKIIETADSETIYRDARHPYTQSLLSAVPEPDPRRKRQRVVFDGGAM